MLALVFRYWWCQYTIKESLSTKGRGPHVINFATFSSPTSSNRKRRSKLGKIKKSFGNLETLMTHFLVTVFLQETEFTQSLAKTCFVEKYQDWYGVFRIVYVAISHEQVLSEWRGGLDCKRHELVSQCEQPAAHWQTLSIERSPCIKNTNSV